jgi:hypothetical protein
MRPRIVRAYGVLAKDSGPVDPGAWANQSAGLGAVQPRPSDIKNPGPTGTYAPHFWADDNPGNMAAIAASKGIMPSIPPGP